MIVLVGIAALLSPMLFQAVPLPDRPMPPSFSAAEKSRLQREQKVDNRIRIYMAASDERQRAVQKAMAERNSEAVSVILRSWIDVLDYSLEDIQTNAGRKSRSKALRNYEIHLRKAVLSINDLKTKGTYEQLEEFEAWLKHAEEVRSRVVAILFPS
ncbi:MAG: hypothetical protein HXY20_05430 [Acidobacteria bacterium]|nr:hypothetical protein [Acidobacteriota bacterium]